MSSEYKSYVNDIKKALKKVENQALNEIGQFVVEKAKDNAPYDPKSKHPVHLKDSLNFEVKGGKVNIGVNENETFKQADRYYARFQEFGTIHMLAANGDRGYLRPAAEDNINKIVEITKTNLGDLGK